MSKIEKRERRTFNDDFKRQIVQLYQQGKRRSELVKDYHLTPSALTAGLKRLPHQALLKQKITAVTKKMN